MVFFYYTLKNNENTVVNPFFYTFSPCLMLRKVCQINDLAGKETNIMEEK